MLHVTVHNNNNYNNTNTHTRLTALFPRLPKWAGTRKVKPIWILLKQKTVSGSGISWAVCKSAPRSRQITMPAPRHSLNNNNDDEHICIVQWGRKFRVAGTSEALKNQCMLKWQIPTVYCTFNLDNLARQLSLNGQPQPQTIPTRHFQQIRHNALQQWFPHCLPHAFFAARVITVVSKDVL